ncbi:hypothetical protein AGMMS49975_15060 [Clostridia bacterium]|nr:hypothetical protein AGMMS49975_15060 [Clostridia bacterium]
MDNLIATIDGQEYTSKAIDFSVIREIDSKSKGSGFAAFEVCDPIVVRLFSGICDIRKADLKERSRLNGRLFKAYLETLESLKNGMDEE